MAGAEFVLKLANLMDLTIHAMIHTNSTQELSHEMLEAQRVTQYIPQ